MENKHKQFAPYDRVLVRDRYALNSAWRCDFYSNYNFSIADEYCHYSASGGRYTDDDILPYEGNESLVGTVDEPEEEIKLEEGELIIVFDDYQKIFDNISCVRKFISVLNTVFETNAANWNFAIRFKDFNPDDMEETKRHILCVKDGKIAKYHKTY